MYERIMKRRGSENPTTYSIRKMIDNTPPQKREDFSQKKMTCQVIQNDLLIPKLEVT